ncbi:multi-sensor hybrid histidine kinase [Rhodopseudomonas palustris HaA2]|uniref:histidine kinase n=1 Tax=Rhodopseudomonas palustris (strain HaA2) TaxID=316058 RepID=Q2IU19_RHOP2|nr:ATP-binding protein [Rhodopseudomonas palustris]ABD08291.1 multi-sensor hybrid histidine kinase [Rhodopseudomonas palustris HaA2]
MPRRLNLSTRLTLAIVPLVALTAATVGYLGYRNLAAIAIERTLAGLDATARSRAVELASQIRNVSADVASFRTMIGLGELIALSHDATLRTAGGRTLAEWRARIEQRFADELGAKAYLIRYRLIGASNDGREIIRVERRNDTVRIVPDDELRGQSEYAFFEQAIRAAGSEVVVSPVELARTDGAILQPPMPLIRVSAALFATDGTMFGLIIADVGLRPAFATATAKTRKGRTVFIINDRGDYLLHPDKSREFGFEFDRPARIQDDFPSLATAITSGKDQTAIVEDRNGVPIGVAIDRVEGAPLAIVETVPQQFILDDIMTAWLDSTLTGGSVAVLTAVLLGFVMARTLIKPLSQMTKAVAGFAEDAPPKMPVAASGEIGVLARAFDTMVQDVQAKTAAIRHEKELFESIMTTMAECVVLIDRNGEAIYQNRANRELLSALDIRVDQWQELYDIYTPDGSTRLSADHWPSARVLRGETVDNYEIVCRRRDSGKTVHLMGSARPLWEAAGTQTGAVVVFRDVTEMRATEHRLHQSQKLEAIGQLTGGVAHDFNNMLTVINGTAEILLDELADRPDLCSIARMIEQAAGRGADLTRQLLAFARRQPLQPRNIDVNAIVLNTQQLLKATIGEHIDVEVRLAQDVDAARVDPSQLSSALLNLAVNARDAMPNGGKLMLETADVVLDAAYGQHNPDVQPGRYVMIAVSDTGTGIPAELCDKVFEPFFTTKSAGQGTGLGLSMVYGFVKQSGGHINIYSEEGHGTTLKLYLPQADSDPAVDSAPDAGPATEGGSETILLVEDDELVRKFAIAQLAGLGYRTIAMCDGQAALREAERGTAFDLLFTDVIMPGGLNGPQLADAIARVRPVRVLYTSGYTENAIVHHDRLDSGALLLTKPYRRSDLARMVRAALGKDVHVPPTGIAAAPSSRASAR